MKTKRVLSNLIAQDCYIRDCCALDELHEVVAPGVYTTLIEKVVNTDKGTSYEQEFVEVPYPITPESVNSYVDSADYHRDPVGAVLSSSPRKNLGDITAFQDVVNMDSDAARALYVQLCERFGGASVESVKQGDVVESVSSDDVEVKK